MTNYGLCSLLSLHAPGSNKVNSWRISPGYLQGARRESATQDIWFERHRPELRNHRTNPLRLKGVPSKASDHKVFTVVPILKKISLESPPKSYLCGIFMICVTISNFWYSERTLQAPMVRPNQSHIGESPNLSIHKLGTLLFHHDSLGLKVGVRGSVYRR